MENKLMTLTNDKELRITSVELVDIINDFRKLESESTKRVYVELQHSDFMKKIRKELDVLKTLGVDNGGNISLVEYRDSKGEIRPCYSLNRDGMLQMLNSESALVRYKTIEYINGLEEENRKLKEGQELISAHKEIKELKNTLSDFRRLTEEAKEMYKPSHKRKLQYDRLIKSVTSDKEEYDIVKEWIFATLEIEKWEDTSIEQNKKIIEIIHTVSRMLNIKKFEQLSLI
ncbi:Rha family transcriptional regulator [Clostridium tertium]|uniref:Rha family transcriptional regulator n=1 Tax=Clostridium tertium TaxID=1559 RepID=UPI0020286FC7|nr:Rha family transcriptional regulator [Clostridium tertium]